MVERKLVACFAMPQQWIGAEGIGVFQQRLKAISNICTLFVLSMSPPTFLPGLLGWSAAAGQLSDANEEHPLVGLTQNITVWSLCLDAFRACFGPCNSPVQAPKDTTSSPEQQENRNRLGRI